VRFIAATNEDPQARVAEGAFRSDLYFRLAQYTIALPPLRHRPEDIPYLAERFVREASIELRRPIQTIVPDAVQLLQQHEWPGNVRELRNVVRQAVLVSKELVVRAEHVRPLLRAVDVRPAVAPAAVGQSLREVAAQAARAAERESIREALRAAQGNRSEAARRLKTDYKTLYIKMKQLGLDPREFASRG